MNEDGNSGNSNISVCDEHYVVPLNATEYLNDQESSVWDYHTRFEFVVHGILICVVGLLGLLGNLAAIVTLSRPQMKNSINTILLGLVSCDCLLIVTSLFMFSLTVFHHTGWSPFTFYYLHIYPLAVPFIYPVAIIAQTGSAYLTMAVTIERYMAVCWPLKARFVCTIGKAKLVVACVAAFAILYNIPRFLELKWEPCYDQEHGINRTKYSPTVMRLDQNYITAYITWMYLVFMYFIPFSTLAIFNLMTWKEMRRAIARRAQLTTQEQKEHNLATMLLVVVLVFFVCNLLPLVVNILELTGTYIKPLANVSNSLVTINSSVNILIYCIFGKKFRTVFLKIFCGKEPPCIMTSTRSQYHKSNGAQMDTTMTTTLPSESMELIEKPSRKTTLKSVRQITVRFESSKTNGSRNNGGLVCGSSDASNNHLDVDRIIKVEETKTDLPVVHVLQKKQAK